MLILFLKKIQYQEAGINAHKNNGNTTKPIHTPNTIAAVSFNTLKTGC